MSDSFTKCSKCGTTYSRLRGDKNILCGACYERTKNFHVFYIIDNFPKKRSFEVKEDALVFADKIRKSLEKDLIAVVKGKLLE